MRLVKLTIDKDFGSFRVVPTLSFTSDLFFVFSKHSYRTDLGYIGCNFFDMAQIHFLNFQLTCVETTSVSVSATIYRE